MLFTLNIAFSQSGQFCPGNIFDNGDIEIGTPTAGDQDINLAQGFSAIWPMGSVADFYAFNAGPFAAKPAPPTGNYAGFWISNTPGNTTYREGLYNEFLTPIPANTGTYSFNFDIACLFGGSADVEIGIYGIYNPSGALGVQPTSMFAPDNLNLFPGNTVLLDKVLYTGTCSNTKTSVTVAIPSNGIPMPSITHIMITHSDTVIGWGEGGGKRYIGVDNFCLVLPETDYCCDNSDNIITNGNFEGGDYGFTSDYTFDLNPFPSFYRTGTNSDALGVSAQWDVDDHSFCTIGSTNSTFLMVNGKTQQASGSESVIWEQTVVAGVSDSSVSAGCEQYKLCANFKNMPQCAFDVLPQVEFRVSGQCGTYHSGFRTINTTSGSCDWQLESYLVNAGGNTTIQIVLKEDGNGDGNDLAIDDIAFQELVDPNYTISVMHDGTSDSITASLGTMNTLDDVLECNSDEYYWYVIEVTSFPSVAYDWTTFAWGSSTASNVTTPFGAGAGPAWDLTTGFPGYPFENDKMYLIGLYTPANIDCCVSDGWTYQLTYNLKSNAELMTDEAKEQMLELFGTFDTQEEENEFEAVSTGITTATEEKLIVYPNPTNNVINVSFNTQNIKNIQVLDYLGNQVIFETANTKSTTLSVKDLSKGVYFINIEDENNQIQTTKFIKK